VSSDHWVNVDRTPTDCPEVWFGRQFLCHPPAGWRVDWDHIDHTTPEPPEDEEWVGSEYMAGILVYHASGRVWRLTGEERGARPTRGELLGRWPD
jgi:hypothetical protein